MEAFRRPSRYRLFTDSDPTDGEKFPVQGAYSSGFVERG
jgi:hypothetical protein